MTEPRAPRRTVNGVLLLDKPGGLTSNAALQRVKRLYRAHKAGHTGSLDPLATGLLPLCFGEATKLSGFLLESDKTYQVTIQLGIRTATADAEGEVIATRPADAITVAQLDAALATFRGAIQQVPPMYSALKRDGRPLYELARQGVEVEREPRAVTIYRLELIHYAQTRAELEVHCSKGTYVRSLADDIGEWLGCGAHVTQLRRITAGPFHAAQMITLAQLETAAQHGTAALDALLLPMEHALSDWPDVHLDDAAAHFLRQGQPVRTAVPGPGWVRIFAGGGRFLGIGWVLDDGRVAPRRLVADA